MAYNSFSIPTSAFGAVHQRLKNFSLNLVSRLHQSILISIQRKIYPGEYISERYSPIYSPDRFLPTSSSIMSYPTITDVHLNQRWVSITDMNRFVDTCIGVDMSVRAVRTTIINGLRNFGRNLPFSRTRRFPQHISYICLDSRWRHRLTRFQTLLTTYRDRTTEKSVASGGIGLTDRASIQSRSQAADNDLAIATLLMEIEDATHECAEIVYNRELFELTHPWVETVLVAPPVVKTPTDSDVSKRFDELHDVIRQLTISVASVVNNNRPRQYYDQYSDDDAVSISHSRARDGLHTSVPDVADTNRPAQQDGARVSRTRRSRRSRNRGADPGVLHRADSPSAEVAPVQSSPSVRNNGSDVEANSPPRS